MRLELSENGNTYTPLGPADERIANDRYVLWMGPVDEPWSNVAQRFRLRPDEIEEVRAEIHGVLRERGHFDAGVSGARNPVPGGQMEMQTSSSQICQGRPSIVC